MIKAIWCDVSLLFDKRNFDCYLSFVSAYRRERILSYRKQEDQARSLAGHLLLSVLLKEEGFPKKEVKNLDNGKPYVDGKGIFVSLSHSHDVAFAVIASSSVGCDVELIKDFKNEVKGNCFGEDEREFTRDNEKAIKIWTIKESLGKAKGDGLASINKNISVVEKGFLKEQIDGYSIFDLGVESSYQFAIVARVKEEVKFAKINLGEIKHV